MKKLYTPEVEQTLTAIGIIAGFYALMAIVAFFA
jgi:hypothetical protein